MVRYNDAMVRQAVTFTLLAAMMVMGCEKAKEQLKPPKRPEIPEPPPITTPKESASAPITFEAYGGPSIVPDAAPGNTVWAALPRDPKGRMFVFAPATLRSIKGTKAQVIFLGRRYEIPGAFVISFLKERIRPGAQVRTAVGGSVLYGTAGRTHGGKTVVYYGSLGKEKKIVVPTHDVAPIPACPARGSWMAVRESGRNTAAIVLAMDDKFVWALAGEDRVVQVAKKRTHCLRPVTSCTKGMHVLVAPMGNLFRATITEVSPHRAFATIRSRGEGSSFVMDVPCAKVFYSEK